VEDLTQDVFLRAYQNFERLGAGSNHRAWLYKIATNCAYSSFRATRNGRGRLLRLKDTAIDEALERSPSSAEAVAKSRLAQRVRNLTNSLPTKQKAALVLRYLQELDYAEIAAIMNCSEPSARANVYQALRCLRAALSE
jgi:RNA polymerase sigma-70 factor (ECF subfamily)